MMLCLKLSVNGVKTKSKNSYDFNHKFLTTIFK